MSTERYWTIRLLGKLEVVGPNQTALQRFRTRKTGSLLAYLALYEQQAYGRDKLIELLWPDSDRPAGRNSLRVSLNSLRQQLEPISTLKDQVLLASGDTLQLNPKHFQTDVACFQASLNAAAAASSLAAQVAHWQQALHCYTGELLPGDSSGWVEAEAERLADQYLSVLCDLSRTLLQQGELSIALDYTQRGLQQDNLCEACHFLKLKIYAQLNRPAKVLQSYEECCQLWQHTFQKPPPHRIQSWMQAFQIGLS